MSFLYTSAAAEDSAVASTKQVWLDEVIVTNVSANKRYLHIFDAATLPANTTAPKVCIAVPTESTLAWDPRGNLGEKFDNGLVVALSSTAAVLTVTTASEGVFSVRGRQGT